MKDEFAVEYNGKTNNGPDISEAKRSLYEGIRRYPGVTGAGIGKNETGDSAIIIYLENEAAGARIPLTWNGYAVVCKVTGQITAGL